MSYEFAKDLVAYVKSQSDITSLVGAKIYTPNAPQGTAFPYLVLESVATDNADATIDSFDNVVNEEWQFDALSKTREDGLKIAWAIDGVFRSFFGAQYLGNFWVSSTQLSGISDNSDLEIEGGQQNIWRYTIRITFRRCLTEQGD